MIILNVLMSIIILIIVPVCMGLFVTSFLPKTEQSIGLVVSLGYLAMLLSFELVTLPILFAADYQNFDIVIGVYTPVMILLSGCGVYRTIKEAGGAKNLIPYSKGLLEIYLPTDKKSKSRRIENIIVWVIAAAVLVFIFVMAETHSIFDGDDAYYVVQSLIAQQNRSMYATLPYTGGAAAIDMRHAMAVFTMWISYVGCATGIHTTILCHSVLPLVLIPLTLLTYSEIGIRLLKDKEDMLPFFVLFLELMILFGRVSLYTSETFLLARTWQGKSLAGNFLIPLCILAIFLLFRNSDKSKGAWIVLTMVNATAGIFSSLAVVLVCIMYALGGIWYGIYTKSIKNVVKVALCCAPGVVYMLIYLYYMYFGWR